MTLSKSSGKKNLSMAIAQLLSIKLVRESNAAGHASAVIRVLNTVIMAPCFINSMAISAEKKLPCS